MLEYPDVIFISNMHMEDLILKVGIDNIHILTVGPLLTTRSKIKQRTLKREP